MLVHKKEKEKHIPVALEALLSLLGATLVVKSLIWRCGGPSRRAHVCALGCLAAVMIEIYQSNNGYTHQLGLWIRTSRSCEGSMPKSRRTSPSSGPRVQTFSSMDRRSEGSRMKVSVPSDCSSLFGTACSTT